MGAEHNLSPHQFGDGSEFHNVVDPSHYEASPVTPVTPRPQRIRPPNAYRTRAGDNGIRRGPNVSQLAQDHNTQRARDMIARGENPHYMDLRAFGLGEHFGTDPKEQPVRKAKWPVIRPGPFMGMN